MLLQNFSCFIDCLECVINYLRKEGTYVLSFVHIIISEVKMEYLNYVKLAFCIYYTLRVIHLFSNKPAYYFTHLYLLHKETHQTKI